MSDAIYTTFLLQVSHIYIDRIHIIREVVIKLVNKYDKNDIIEFKSFDKAIHILYIFKKIKTKNYIKLSTQLRISIFFSSNNKLLKPPCLEATFCLEKC